MMCLHHIIISLLLLYEATDMNIYRSALSASVIMGLPNVRDYIHQHRDRLMEEKRQKLLALDAQRSVQNRVQENPVHAINIINEDDLNNNL